MNKKIKLLGITLLTTFLSINMVYAEDNKQANIDYIEYNNGLTINSSITTAQESQHNLLMKSIDGGTADQFFYIYFDRGTTSELTGYCVEPGTSLNDKSTAIYQKTLSDYLNDATKYNKINEYIAYGYNKSDNNKNTAAYYVATQALIWKAQGKTTTFSLSKDDSTYGASVRESIKNAMDQIEAEIANSKKIPSMCSSTEKLELEVNESKTFEDTNGVLNNYTVTCSDGLTCTKNGNKLTVTANSERKSQTISFSKSKITVGTGTSLVFKPANQQNIATWGATIAPITCEFGIDTYVSEQTSETKIVGIIMIAVLSGTIGYLLYYSRKTLKELN